MDGSNVSADRKFSFTLKNSDWDPSNLLFLFNSICSLWNVKLRNWGRQFALVYRRFREFFKLLMIFSICQNLTLIGASVVI